jgi:carbamoyltransferase
MNEALHTNLNTEVFVPPYCSDPSQALGNAIWGYVNSVGSNANSLIQKIQISDYYYIGTEYTNDRTEKEIVEEYSDDIRISFRKSDKPLHECAKMISENKIVAIFQGRSEYGARALGNRSILAMPNNIQLRDRINTLKGRELLHPLAPAVMSEFRDEYFESHSTALDFGMLRVVAVKSEKRDAICGVTHIDSSARLQEVVATINPCFHALISEVYHITGIPIVINTSFNRAGEPIVETVHDAVESFIAMKLDALLCGDYESIPKIGLICVTWQQAIKAR